jgi:hypothetical protein
MKPNDQTPTRGTSGPRVSAVRLRCMTNSLGAGQPTTPRLGGIATTQRHDGGGFCTDMHTKDAVAAGESLLRLNLVAAWREVTVFHRGRARSVGAGGAGHPHRGCGRWCHGQGLGKCRQALRRGPARRTGVRDARRRPSGKLPLATHSPRGATGSAARRPAHLRTTRPEAATIRLCRNSATGRQPVDSGGDTLTGSRTAFW